MKRSNLIIVVFILVIAAIFGLAKFSPLNKYFGQADDQQNQEQAQDDSVRGADENEDNNTNADGGESRASGETTINSRASVSNGVAESKAEANGQVSHEIVLTATQDDQNAFELLKDVAQVEYEDYGDAGYLVTSINGTKSDKSHYWAFYVNGEYSNTGVSQTTLKLGDELKFVLEEIDESAR